MTKDIKKNCVHHGNTLFKHKQNKKGEWWVCHECLKIQWKKAQAKQRKKYAVRQYQANFNKELNLIRRHLSVYLTMILIASKIKPE